MKSETDTLLDHEEKLWSPEHPEDGIYEIPAENFGKLQKKIKTLANKADKLGLPAPELEIVGEQMVPIFEVDSHGTNFDTGRKRKVHSVKVSGQSPIIEGWLLIAVIDHFSSGQRGVNMIRRYPQDEEVEIPDEYRTVSQRCDHCQTVRNRKDTFLLSEVETGEYKLVGRQCLKDFLGHLSPEALANYARFILDLMGAATEENWGGDYQAWYINLDELLTTTAAVMRLYGWLGRTRAREQMRAGDATADLALYSMSAKKDEDRVPITDEDRDLANETITWLREVLAEKDHLNDYEWNLVASTADDELDWKNVGVAASAIYAYQRANNLLEERKREEETGERWGENSQHQGEVKKRYDLLLTVRRMIPIETEYGTLKITVMDDENGNVYVWRTTAEKMEEGRTYNVRGTVKEHGEYNGIPQTVLTRCKVTCANCGTLDYQWISQTTMICHGCNLLEKKSHMMEEA
jgi:hypothetical protein